MNIGVYMFLGAWIVIATEPLWRRPWRFILRSYYERVRKRDYEKFLVKSAQWDAEWKAARQKEIDGK